MLRRIRHWHESRRLQRLPVTTAQWQSATADWPVVQAMSADDRERLRELSLRFLLRKRFESGGDLVLTAAMQLRIATMAALPILNLGLDWYRGWTSVIVYPAEFVPPGEYEDEFGVVHRDRHPLSGEAWFRGPVILAWDDVRAVGGEPGFNVVIHEMAHKLDMLSDGPNGSPPLHADMKPRAWRDSFQAAWDDLTRREAEGEELPIDPYALEDPGEFFAVSSEYFFEAPAVLAGTWPEVYRQLSRFYRQDPLAR